MCGTVSFGCGIVAPNHSTGRRNASRLLLEIRAAPVKASVGDMTETFDIPFVLSGIGLAAATGGAFLLYFFGAPPLKVTESGEKIVEWCNTVSDTERQKNARRFAMP